MVQIGAGRPRALLAWPGGSRSSLALLAKDVDGVDRGVGKVVPLATPRCVTTRDMLHCEQHGAGLGWRNMRAVADTAPGCSSRRRWGCSASEASLLASTQPRPAGRQVEAAGPAQSAVNWLLAHAGTPAV